MTCRVARSFQDQIRKEPISCCECGSTPLEVGSVPHTLGPSPKEMDREDTATVLE